MDIQEENEKLQDLDEMDEEKIKELIVTKLFKHRKMLLRIISIVFVIVLCVLLRSAWAKNSEQQAEINQLQEQINGLIDRIENTPVITVETLKEQLSAVSELVTKEYIYTNSAKYESDEVWIFGWKRPFSSKSILVTYDGSIKAGIDLQQVEIGIDEQKHIITVKLPNSTVTDNNIPQDTITVVEIKNGLFNEVTIDDYNLFINEQREVMEERAIANGLLTQADTEARRIVETTLSLLPGIEEYEVVFG